MSIALSRMQEAVDAYRRLPRGKKLGEYVFALLKLHDLHYYTNFEHIRLDEAQGLLDEAERLIKKNGGPVHPAFLALPKQQSRFSRWQGDHEQATKTPQEHLPPFVA